MADYLQLQQIPGQSFETTLGDNNYNIRIFDDNGHMAYDLILNGVSIIDGFKFVNEILMLPYPHQEINGNLILIVPEDEMADYTRFEASQFLAYLNQAETDAYRNRIEVV